MQTQAPRQQEARVVASTIKEKINALSSKHLTDMHHICQTAANMDNIDPTVMENLMKSMGKHAPQGMSTKQMADQLKNMSPEQMKAQMSQGKFGVTSAAPLKSRSIELQMPDDMMRRLEHAEGIQRQTEEVADICARRVAVCEQHLELVRRMEHAESILRQTEEVADDCTKRMADCEQRAELAKLGLASAAPPEPRSVELSGPVELVRRLEHAEGIQRQTEEVADACSRRVAVCEQRVDLVRRMEHAESILRQTEEVADFCSQRVDDHEQRADLVRRMEHAEGILYQTEEIADDCSKRVADCERNAKLTHTAPAGGYEQNTRELQIMLDSHQGQVRTLEAENAALRAEHASMHAGNAAAEEVKYQLASLQSENLALRQQQAEIVRNSDVKVQDVTQVFSQQLIERDEEIAVMRSRIAELDNGAPPSHHHQEMSELQKLHAREVHALKAENESLRVGVADYERAIADLNATAAELEALRSRQAQAEGTERDMEVLRQQVGQMERQHAMEVRVLKEQLAAEHEDKYSALHSASEQEQRDHRELQIRHRDLQERFQGLQAERQQGPSPQEHEELSQRVAQIEQLMEKEQETHLRAMQSSEQQIQHLNDELSAAREQLILKQELSLRVSQIEQQLEKEKETHLFEVQSSQQQINRLKDELVEAREQLKVKEEEASMHATQTNIIKDEYQQRIQEMQNLAQATAQPTTPPSFTYAQAQHSNSMVQELARENHHSQAETATIKKPDSPHHEIADAGVFIQTDMATPASDATLLPSAGRDRARPRVISMRPLTKLAKQPTPIHSTHGLTMPQTTLHATTRPSSQVPSTAGRLQLKADSRTTSTVVGKGLVPNPRTSRHTHASIAAPHSTSNLTAVARPPSSPSRVPNSQSFQPLLLQRDIQQYPRVDATAARIPAATRPRASWR